MFANIRAIISATVSVLLLSALPAHGQICGVQSLAPDFPGANNLLDAAIRWDPDGAGPAKPQLVIGGGFTSIAGFAVNGVARWDGNRWQAFGSGIISSLHALLSWDPDGDGPTPAQLIAGGGFETAGGASANGIARWTGTAWASLGSGVAPPPPMGGVSHGATVQALAAWDPDGEGPLGPQVVVGGLFQTAGGILANNIALWDGTAWHALGDGLSGGGAYPDTGVQALTLWDPDGPGPLSLQIVAAGRFVTVGSTTLTRIARWDGTAWQPFGSGINGPVTSMISWDSDGDPSTPDELVATGLFTYAGGVPATSTTTPSSIPRTSLTS